MEKKFHFLLIGIVYILTISMLGSVCAIDINITNTTSGGLKTAVENASSNDRIILDNGIYSGDNNRGIIIDKNLSIIGESKGKAIIDAQGKNNIFSINTSVTLRLVNITIRNGYAEDFYGESNGLIASSGGAIDNNGYLIINDCVFSNNIAYDSLGGAIIIMAS